MSNIYNLEPPTKGKVTIRTTVGDLDIELWPKEAPKAVRNFVQLCLEGYYDGCIFHRIIKDFMVQTGDPTGTGEGGESIYNGPFKDEFHSRLRFNHRGLVACANRNEPHSNGSQFFITLDKCDWLDRKNTIFGKIVGETIYNLLRMNDMEVDESNDRPVDPPRILSVDVVWNPFEDIVPRITPEERKAQEQFKKAAETRKDRTSRKRNLALLSFGDQAEEDEHDLAAAAAAAAAPKIKSAHEVLKGDSKLLAPEETPEEVLMEQQQRAAALKGVQDRLRQGAKRSRTGSSSSSSDDDDGDDDADDNGRVSHKKSRGRSGTAAAAVAERVKAAADKADKARAARAAAAAAGDDHRGRGREQHDGSTRRSSSSGSDHSSRSRSRSRGAERGRQQPPAAAAASAAAAGDGGSSRLKSKEDEFYEVKNKQGAGRIRVDDTVADAELLKAFELSRQKYKTRKQQVGNRQKDTLARLAAFTEKLRTNKQQQQQQRQEPAEAAAAAAAKQAEEQAAMKQQQAAAAAAAAAAKKDEEGAAAAAATEQPDEAYDGKVRTDIDHRSYMPAAWRVDDYLNQQEDDEDDLSTLRHHKLEFSKAPGAGVDAMARSDNLDDYVVYDPLLEAAKGKFSRSAQREKKKQTQWAGRGQG